MINELAIVKTDQLAEGVIIHPFVILKENVTLGKNVVIHPFVVIESNIEIGENVEIFPYTYIGKVPKGAGATSRKPIFSKTTRIGSDCSIGPHATIYYDVDIGHNTLIGDNASIRENVKVGSYCIISRGVTINYNTVIGNRTKIMDLSHITGNCTIGDDVFISTLVKTTNDNSMGKHPYDEMRIKGPTIHNKAMIGAGANLLPNITIGEGSIVGASALVTKDISPGKLAVGIPAREVRNI